MKKLFFILLLATQFMFANNLNITNVQKVDNHLSFDVSWDNSWWVSTYRDASWIFIKYKNSSGQWQHLDITSATVTGFTLYTYPDHKGIMLSRAFSGQGTVTGSVTVQFNGGVLGPLPDFKVFGIEMVYVNPGAFYVGDGQYFHRFHQGNNNTLPYHIQSAGQITVGNTSNDLKSDGLTQNIPATFPNGYKAFYLMKYEITQEQYMEFLNTLTATQQQTRTKTDLSAITTANRFVMTSNSSSVIHRNGIACDANATNATPITFYCDLNNNSIPNENADGQNIATVCNPADSMAYMDWAALRLATEFEYEKACRGTAYPIAHEVANGTSLVVNAGSIVNAGMPNESVSNINTDGLINIGLPPKRVGIFATASSTRLQSGAGFYGNMELSGNASELYVNPAQISYAGNFGDGLLDATGDQNEWNLSGLFHDKVGTSVSNRFHTISITETNRNYNSRGCR